MPKFKPTNRLQQANQRRLWRSVFNYVMERYKETKASYLSISVEGFYKGLTREGARNEFNAKVVAPSPVDFICDVEVAARRALNLYDAEYELFLDVYVNNLRTLKRGEKSRMRRSMAERVGKMFIQRGIYPLEEYLKPKDIR